MSNFITVTGRANTSAKIIADSICDGKRITTFELEYPRFVHAEFMTHRLFSRNAASSRAIPVSRMLELVTERPATFVHWGKNQAGMQANEEMDEVTRAGAKEHWRRAALQASHIAESLSILGAHKQIVNRLLEPFQMMKVVCTATEWDNFLYLRNHKDAQPEIHELASVMWEAMKKSTPEELFPGEWHTPYVDHARRGESALCPNELLYCKLDEMGLVTEWLTKEEALIVSASCCAQVSYRRQDDSLEKAKEIYKRLIESKPCHASPVEHQASPMKYSVGHKGTASVTGEDHWRFTPGITHQDIGGSLWSGNFCGWIQARQLIEGHTCWNYQP